MKKINTYNLLICSLALVYILFGIFKVLDRSSVKDLVVAAMPFMQNTILFQLFGLIEILLGVFLIPKATRKYAAIGIIIHLLGTFSTLILASQRIFSPDTFLTLEGEFVVKNLVLGMVALYIYKMEKLGKDC